MTLKKTYNLYFNVQASFLPIAKEDIKETAFWYNSRQKELGKKITTEVRLKLNTLKLNPYVNAIRYDGIRTSVFEVFPFMAHYSIDEKNKLIVISAVLHTSSDPNIWTEREK